MCHRVTAYRDPNQYGFPHLTMYDTPDIDAAYAFAKQQGYTIFVEPQRFPNVAHFNMLDDAGNGIMLCWSPERTEGAPALSRPEPHNHHPIRHRINRVFARTDDVVRTAQWYEGFFGDLSRS